jgi:serine O-acetyltransferase
MASFTELYDGDMSRYSRGVNGWTKKYLYFFRKASTCSNRVILNYYYRFRFRKLSEKHGMEIHYTTEIGKGLYIGHPYNITINPNARLGENINIHKGVVIGQENRGPRKGVPTIGNQVWIGINSIIVGKVKIGDDVLIAPNSYVNCDVPSHSIVLGNPCRIISRDNATEGYINDIV